MEIKDQMREYFELPEINQLILRYVKNHQLSYEDLDHQQLYQIIEELGLMEPLLEFIQKPLISQQQQEKDSFQIKNSLKNISFTIEKGRKFEQFHSFQKNSKFFISVGGFGQKFKTNELPLQQNFTLNQKMIFKVKPNLLNLEPNSLSFGNNLQLSVIIAQKNGKKILFSIKLIEWRYLLCYGSLSFDIQLAPYYHEGVNELPCAGILTLKMQLAPLSKFEMTPERVVKSKMELEKKDREQNNNKFYGQANRFWNEFKDTHKSFQNRRVKIYGDSEDKVFYPLTKMICPLYNIRGIESPNHALRFVSLIPFQDHTHLINHQHKNIHKRFNSMLASRSGSVDDHCHLLCALLLGFGLKAYVCIGYNLKGEHSWVMTEQNKTIYFWECTRGVKFEYYSTKTFNFYKSIHMIYNHSEFYANIQLDDSISGCKFDFKDINLWKKMNSQHFQNINSYNCQLSLYGSSMDAFTMEQQLQNSLVDGLSAFRKKNKLDFAQDEVMASILSIALSNYEIERITGQTFCQQQFQSAIKTYIPLKHTFKAFPIQLTTISPEEIIEELINQPKCKEIMLIRANEVHYAFKCKLVVFPDNIFALWVSLAVRYYKIN